MKFEFDIPNHLVQSIIDTNHILWPWSIAWIEQRCRDTERIEYEVWEIVTSQIIKEYAKRTDKALWGKASTQRITLTIQRLPK